MENDLRHNFLWKHLDGEQKHTHTHTPLVGGVNRIEKY